MTPRAQSDSGNYCGECETGGFIRSSKTPDGSRKKKIIAETAGWKPGRHSGHDISRTSPLERLEPGLVAMQRPSFWNGQGLELDPHRPYFCPENKIGRL